MSQFNPVYFVNLEPNVFGFDLNEDGKYADYEKFTVKPDEDPYEKAQAFIKSNPHVFWKEIEWQPFVETGLVGILGKPVRKFFQKVKTADQNQRKQALRTQLDQDIAKLESIPNRPTIYGELLSDLKLMRTELPNVHFRDPQPNEFGETREEQSGFIGIYYFITKEMVVNNTQGMKVPVSLIIHELDHHLTNSRRVQPWSVPFSIKLEDGQTLQVPKDPHLPSPDKTQTTFSFDLDFPAGAGANHLTYNDVDFWDPVLRNIASGAEVCTTRESRDASLASEIRGYVTMARYLLFRIEFTLEDIQALKSGTPQEQFQKRQELKNRLRKHLHGSSLNSDGWAYPMLLSYLGVGGNLGGKNLTRFIEDYYLAIGAPGFVDPPGCIR